MPRAGLPSGPSSSSHSTELIGHGELSSRKFWPTSPKNGRRPNSLKSTTHIQTGSCTSTAPKCWLSGAGVVLTSSTGDMVQYVLQIMYPDSNNAAEYEALLHGLRMAISMGIQRLEVCGDSNLAISQINGDFDAKDTKMASYRNTVLKMSAWFEGLEFHHIARENNQAADVLARIGAKRDAIPPTSSWKGCSSHP